MYLCIILHYVLHICPTCLFALRWLVLLSRECRLQCCGARFHLLMTASDPRDGAALSLSRAHNTTCVEQPCYQLSYIARLLPASFRVTRRLTGLAAHRASLHAAPVKLSLYLPTYSSPCLDRDHSYFPTLQIRTCKQRTASANLACRLCRQPIPVRQPIHMP